MHARQRRLDGADLAVSGMLVEHVLDRAADPQRRVQGGAGILGHVGDEAAAQLTRPRLVAVLDSLTDDADLAMRDADAGPRVAEQGERGSRLAGARFADETEDLTRRHLER